MKHENGLSWALFSQKEIPQTFFLTSNKTENDIIMNLKALGFVNEMWLTSLPQSNYLMFIFEVNLN